MLIFQKNLQERQKLLGNCLGSTLRHGHNDNQQVMRSVVSYQYLHITVRVRWTGHRTLRQCIEVGIIALTPLNNCLFALDSEGLLTRTP